MEFYYSKSPGGKEKQLVFVVSQYHGILTVMSLSLLSGWNAQEQKLKQYSSTWTPRLGRLVDKYKILPTNLDVRREHLEDYYAALDALILAEYFTFEQVYGVHKPNFIKGLVNP